MSKKDYSKKWWHDGIQFECQGSGKCCVSRDSYGFVYMNKEDRIRMAKVLDMTTSAFTRKYCEKSDGLYHLKDGDDERCIFLDKNRCNVYEGRPSQCRTWPFWPEVMNAKVWQKEVADFCPGVGNGRLWKKEEIQKILSEQERADEAP